MAETSRLCFQKWCSQIADRQRSYCFLGDQEAAGSRALVLLPRSQQVTAIIRKLPWSECCCNCSWILINAMPMPSAFTKQICCSGSWHLQSSWLANGTWPTCTPWPCLPTESTEAAEMQALPHFYLSNLVVLIWLALYLYLNLTEKEKGNCF